MKIVLLAVALHGLANDGALGVGLDVLPEAFSFAASRVAYAPQIRLTRCRALQCRWDLGGGIEMSASLAPGSLGLNRIEIDVSIRRDTGPEIVEKYRKACLAMVTMMDGQAPPPDQRSLAASISMLARDSPPNGTTTSEAGIKFYGFRGAAGSETMMRCGATITSIEGSKPE